MHERLDKVAKLVFAVLQALRRRYAFKKRSNPYTARSVIYPRHHTLECWTFASSRRTRPRGSVARCGAGEAAVMPGSTQFVRQHFYETVEHKATSRQLSAVPHQV